MLPRRIFFKPKRVYLMRSTTPHPNSALGVIETTVMAYTAKRKAYASERAANRSAKLRGSDIRFYIEEVPVL
jgi:hypothetical protein